MSNRTKSEILFTQYAIDLGCGISEIPTQADDANRTPDFRLVAPETEVIVEVTELRPNEDDKRVEGELSATGTSSWTTIPGKRLRKKLENKFGQLRSYENMNIPCVIVILDNRIVNGHYATHQNHHLEHEDLSQGLYGQRGVAIYSDEDGGIDHTEDRLMGNRTVHPSHGTELSAVCIMTEDFKTKKIRMFTYHNSFASVKLPMTMFSGPDDLHFKNPKSEGSFLLSWEKR